MVYNISYTPYVIYPIHGIYFFATFLKKKHLKKSNIFLDITFLRLFKKKEIEKI